MGHKENKQKQHAITKSSQPSGHFDMPNRVTIEAAVTYLLLPMSVNQENFREAMANLASAVTLVTTNGDAGKNGLTASAVCSVTDEPPTLLVCVNQDSVAHDSIKANGQLCVNICSGSQEEISRHFAGMTDMSLEERFDLDIWETGKLNIPMLAQSLASLEGPIARSSEIGTHTVFFVEIENIVLREAADALTYFARQFKTLDV